jgi:hypothetical protein
MDKEVPQSSGFKAISNHILESRNNFQNILAGI